MRDAAEVTTSPPPAWRAALALRSRAALVMLARGPRWVLPLVLGILLLIGLLQEGPVGAVPLLLVLAVVGWLSTLSWPAIDRRARLLRLVTLGLLGAAALDRLL